MAETTTRHPVSSEKLWFGLTASAAAWIVLGIGDLLITWWACGQNQPFGAGSVRSGIAALYSFATLLLLGVTAAAGTISYFNWRRLSGAGRLLAAEARGRQEFIALLGVFVSFTLGFGLIWLTIPLLILDLCVRAR